MGVSEEGGGASAAGGSTLPGGEKNTASLSGFCLFIYRQEMRGESWFVFCFVLFYCELASIIHLHCLRSPFIVYIVSTRAMPLTLVVLFVTMTKKAFDF